MKNQRSVIIKKLKTPRIDAEECGGIRNNF